MITSPVSRFSVAARSYLTTIIILMLVLVAVHFSIQAWGQQQARQWVSAWEKQYTGHVGSVRLRMLRGALTMRDVWWKSEGVRFYAPFVLLRGNLSDSISNVDIREIVLQDAEITVSNGLFQQVIQKKAQFSSLLPWSALLDDVRNIYGKDMDIVVQAGTEQALPLQAVAIHHAIFSSMPQKQQWKLSGDVWDGRIYVSNLNNQQTMTWSNLDAMDFTASLGLAALHGRMDGKGSWQNKQLSGEITWQDKASTSHKDVIQQGSLAFQGELDQSVWQGDIRVADWPLQMFSRYTPVLHERMLKSAYLTGLIQLKSKKQGWQASMMEGNIRDLDYHSNVKDAWHLQDIDFQQATLTWPQRSLRIRNIMAAQGSWALNSSTLETEPAISTAWQVDFPAVTFKAIKVGDIAKNIWLPDVQGTLSLNGQKMSMKAGSDSKAMGEWKLQAQGMLGEKLDMKAQAQRVPLLNFRDALPQTLVQDARLNGDVSLDVKGVWQQTGWQLHGDMSGQDIMWNRGAWLWRAERMQLKNIVFSSSQMPYADVWQVHNWLGQTSLTPWFKAAHVNITQQEKTPFHLDGWKIKHINIGYGKFSIGQEDAVWFESDKVQLDRVEENQVVNVHMQGLLAGGRFIFKGDWFPWGRTPWVSLHASLKQALPFVAAPWMQLSGLPIFTRGRISADLKINQVAKKPHHYQGEMQVHLHYGQLQNGVSSNQMLSEATGYGAHALFDRINSNGDIHLNIPLKGNWVQTPLNSHTLGQGLLSALADKASLEAKPLANKTMLHLSNIRLHDSFGGRVDSLKHNERVRLRKVLHVLRREKKWAIELRPQLGQEILNEQLIRRVRNTQQQIEAFLIARGVSRSRIFPVWPEEADRQGESTGILIQAVK